MSIDPNDVSPESIIERSYQASVAEITRRIVGEKLDEVLEPLLDAGWTVHEVKVDGRSMVGTCDFRRERINVEIENGIIASVAGFG